MTTIISICESLRTVAHPCLGSGCGHSGLMEDSRAIVASHATCNDPSRRFALAVLLNYFESIDCLLPAIECQQVNIVGLFGCGEIVFDCDCSEDMMLYRSMSIEHAVQSHSEN